MKFFFGLVAGLLISCLMLWACWGDSIKMIIPTFVTFMFFRSIVKYIQINQEVKYNLNLR